MSTTRDARHIALAGVGAEGQARIAAGRVLIVGLGGLGCPAAQYLATSGVGSLILNDFDRVDETNLSRQILCLAPDQLEAEISGATIVLDGSDNFATRLAVNRGAVRQRTPLISGAAIRFEGQIGVFRNDGVGPCYRCLYDDEDEWLGSCQGNGVLAPVPGVIGTLMAVEALKLLLLIESALQNYFLIWDAKCGDWRRVAVNVSPSCPECQAAAAS
jgi:adenylyltransferase/sulfurtransferase